jgi:hypothetical protein
MALHRLFPTPEIFNRPILKDKNFRILSKIAVFHCFLSKTDKDGLSNIWHIAYFRNAAEWDGWTLTM